VGPAIAKTTGRLRPGLTLGRAVERNEHRRDLPSPRRPRFVRCPVRSSDVRMGQWAAHPVLAESGNFREVRGPTALCHVDRLLRVDGP
jgi:hypothetical protein